MGSAEQRIIDYLREEYPSKVSGRDLRSMLNEGVPWWQFWARWSAPTFYRMMGWLVETGQVERLDQPSRIPGCGRVLATYFRWVPSQPDGD